jgi:hypothetical protein
MNKIQLCKLTIIGNLTIFQDILEILIEYLDLPSSILFYLLSEQPMFIQQTYRIFVNLMINGHLDAIRFHLKIIMKSLVMVVHNSLNAELLTQAAQFL